MANLESANPSANNMLGVLHRLLPVVGPALLISVGYLDPGKWAATAEAGARFGSDLAALMLIFNFAAILCHYLSARIGVVTGRDLAKICSEEYDKGTCIFLGVQTEVSVILSDLTMILGIAHGLNLLFGWDLFTCVFLTAVNAVLYPLFSTLLETCKAKVLCVCIAGFIQLSFVLGVIISQPEMSFSMNGMLTKLSGESAFALMSLLGASIMPHSLYLHSSIVQQYQCQPTVSRDALCHHHLVAILCIFSGIYLVNYALMTSAENEYSGLGLLTFQDVMSLIGQVFWGPIVSGAFLLVLFVSNQITTLSWSLGGQVVLNDFLKLDLPGWLHCATIRIIAIVPALYFVWSSGAEGMYQLLIFTQVLAALLLPSSVIPLFRIAASRPIMGVHKVSQFVEFLSLITLIGMLGLKIIFVVEVIVGNSDWVNNLRSNAGSSMSLPCVLLLTACATFCLMIWLAATPLKSASARLEAQVWNWDLPVGSPDSITKKEEITEPKYHREVSVQRHEPSPSFGRALDSDSEVASFDLDLPETITEPDQELHLTTVVENGSHITFPRSPKCHMEGSTSTVESTPVSTVVNEVSDVTMEGTSALKIESTEPIEKTVGVEGVEGDLPNEKDDDEGDTWEPEDSLKGVSESTAPLTSEGPGSFRSLSGKGDEGGSSAGSLSRLAGLGRAARRQLAAVLDEFWGQLYDFHGNVIQEAKAKKLDLLLGLDSKAASSSLKVDTSANELSGYFPSAGGRGSDPIINSSLYDSPKQQRVQSSLESYGVQRGSSSLLPSHMQLLDAYVQNSSRSVIDSGERRYSSVRSLPSSESWDSQPATIHGYQLSYLNRIAKDRGFDNLNGQMESPAALKSASSLGAANYRDSLAFTMGQKLQNGLGSGQASSFQNLTVSRNSPLQSERPYYDLRPSGIAENVVSPANAKKYHSLPDIHRDLYMPEKSANWESPVGYGSSTGITNYESSLYSNSGARTGAPLAFDQLSPSQVYRDAFSSQQNSSFNTGSLWSRQPFEQFGVADNNRTIGSGGFGYRAGSVSQEATSVADSEAKLLQSFRHCIVKLLKLEGSDWLFTQNDGVDEDLIDRVAAREKFLYEAETREMNRTVHMGEPQYHSSDRKSVSAMKNNDANCTYFMVPTCGEGCIWRSDLIVSFGVWCIHRILDLSLMESRPELWGKYTYVLNRLQGIIDSAFSKPRTPMLPCFCLQIPAVHQLKSSPSFSNGIPPAAKPARGKCTTAVTLLDIIKDVEIAISCRKGRTGTAAGDVAFPKGKENLASVLKRYKRRLTNKTAGTHEGPGSRKVQTSAPYGS